MTSFGSLSLVFAIATEYRSVFTRTIYAHPTVGNNLLSGYHPIWTPRAGDKWNQELSASIHQSKWSWQLRSTFDENGRERFANSRSSFGKKNPLGSLQQEAPSKTFGYLDEGPSESGEEPFSADLDKSSAQFLACWSARSIQHYNRVPYDDPC